MIIEEYEVADFEAFERGEIDQMIFPCVNNIEGLEKKLKEYNLTHGKNSKLVFYKRDHYGGGSCEVYIVIQVVNGINDSDDVLIDM